MKLLDGRASAGLRADALGGKLSPTPPDPQKRFAEERRARIAELTTTNPFGGQGQKGNLSHSLELYQLDPALAKKLEAEAHPEPTAAQKREMQLKAAQVDHERRQESLRVATAHLRAQHQGF